MKAGILGWVIAGVLAISNVAMISERRDEQAADARERGFDQAAQKDLDAHCLEAARSRDRKLEEVARLARGVRDSFGPDEPAELTRSRIRALEAVEGALVDLRDPTKTPMEPAAFIDLIREARHDGP